MKTYFFNFLSKYFSQQEMSSMAASSSSTSLKPTNWVQKNIFLPVHLKYAAHHFHDDHKDALLPYFLNNKVIKMIYNTYFSLTLVLLSRPDTPLASTYYNNNLIIQLMKRFILLLAFPLYFAYFLLLCVWWISIRRNLLLLFCGRWNLFSLVCSLFITGRVKDGA